MGIFKFCAKTLKDAKEKIKEKNKHGSTHYSLRSVKRAGSIKDGSVCKEHGNKKLYKTRAKYNPEKDIYWE